MKRPNSTSPFSDTPNEHQGDTSPLAILNFAEGARTVCQQMACLRAQYAQVDDTHTGAEWSLRDHVANTRMRLDRLAKALALDVPVTGLEVEIARSLHERVQILVHICEQRKYSAQETLLCS